MRTCTLPTAFAESVAALSQRRGFSELLACTTEPMDRSGGALHSRPRRATATPRSGSTARALPTKNFTDVGGRPEFLVSELPCRTW